MPQITDIRRQKQKLRFNIYLDEKYSFSLPADVLVKSGLKIGQPLSDKEIEELIKENEFARVYDRVLKFLSFRPRSEKELRDWFSKKQVGEETKKMVWKKLEHLGYINDEEFAKWWIEQRTSFRPTGKYALARELKQKGIPRDLIAQLLDGSIVSLSEIELAKKAVEKKVKLYSHLPLQEFRQKLASFLARRGFSWETIREVVKQNLG